MCCSQNLRLRLLATSLAIVLVACQTRKPATVLYPIDSLLNAQVKALAVRNARLVKQARLDDEQEQNEYVPPDKAAWKRELDIFFELGLLNKPASRFSYVMADEVDENSNLMIRSFTDTTGLPVQVFKVYFAETPGKPRIIEARYAADHALYATAREMTMEFRAVEGELMLTSYRVTGGQKMMLGDSVSYSISGKIQFD